MMMTIVHNYGLVCQLLVLDLVHVDLVLIRYWKYSVCVCASPTYTLYCIGTSWST